ncbi:MAG: C-GCAxxG-C-C family protein [Eubacteriales bacterium]
MLKDLANQYAKGELQYGEERALYHYNCAETMLYACNDYYNLKIDPKTLKGIIPFGSGFCCEKTCGILSAGIFVLGLMYSEEKPSLNEKVKEATKKWVIAFEKEFGDLNCDKIKEKHRHEIEKCIPVSLRAAEIFEEVMNQ